ncbi:MAG TPA: hypothetical protein VF550_18605 [Polyangia bacterium]
MRLNPHLHVVALDGVYIAGPDGQPVFRALGRLKTDEVADVVQLTNARVLKALERRGVVRVSPDALEVDDALANRDPVLAQLAAAAVAGLPAPAGPRACPPCPCPTRLRRARRPLALPSANASHWHWSRKAGSRSSAIWWCKTAVSTYTRKHAPVPPTTKPAPAFRAMSCAHRLPRTASPSCLTTASD